MSNKFNIVEIDFDLKYGFVWALNEESENIFQACLELREDNKGFKKEISTSESGWDWGISGDYNESLGNCSSECYDTFIKECRKSGIKVIS